MITPTVTEITRTLEPVARDTFNDDARVTYLRPRLRLAAADAPRGDAGRARVIALRPPARPAAPAPALRPLAA